MHKILVINAIDRDSANEFCNLIGAEGETFTISLFNSDDQLSGYWCGWNLNIEQLKAINANLIFKVFNTPSEALSVTGWHVQEVDPLA